MSSVARAHPGTVFIASPAATVVTTDVISGRPSARRLDAQRLAGQRADGAASAGGVRPRVRRHARQLHRPPQRALACRDQVAVLAGALEDQGRRGVRGAGRAGGIAQPHLLVGADDQPQLAKGTAVAERLHRHRRQHQAALHVGDAGAEAAHPLAPERPLGDGAQREDGVAVSEQRDHARRPRRAARCRRCAPDSPARRSTPPTCPAGRATRPAARPRAPARRRRTACRC